MAGCHNDVALSGTGNITRMQRSAPGDFRVPSHTGVTPPLSFRFRDDSEMLNLVGCEHVLLGGAVKVSSEIWEGESPSQSPSSLSLSAFNLSESNTHFPTRGPSKARASPS